MRRISVAELVDLVVVEAAGRLVEQQQLGLGGERARQLDALLRAERQAGDGQVRDRAELAASRSGPPPSRSVRRSCRRTQGRRSASDSGSLREAEWAPTRMLSRTDSLLKAATFWKVRPMPMPAIRCGGLAEDVAAVELDGAGARRVEAAEAVEQRRLAGAVRTDQPEDLALADLEADAVERHDAAEANRDVTDGDDGRRGRSDAHPSPGAAVCGTGS